MKVSCNFDALGRRIAAAALARNRYRFQCREWSAATGLVNFRARWCDPATGRWISKDPIGLSGGLNLYAFCGDDPVNNTDHSGLNTDEDELPDIPNIDAFTRRHAPTGNDYEADPFGHNTKPGTNTPIDPHFHQYPPNGPKRSFNLDGTPRDGGPPIPKRDLPVVNRVINDMKRAIRGLRMPLPIMVMPPPSTRNGNGNLLL